MDESGANDFRSLTFTNAKILQNLNIDSSLIDSLVTFLFENQEVYHLDLFPFIITDEDKYKRVEVFYQKYLDKVISKSEFTEHERKYHDFIKMLWLYNNVYVQINTDVKQFKNSSYAKRNKRKWKKHKQFLYDIIGDFKELYFVNSLEKLEVLLFLATREISPVLFYFDKFNVILYLDGCSGLLYHDKTFSHNDLINIVTMHHLYLLR